MSSKEIYCYRILKKYSLLVDFEGDPGRDNVLDPVSDETLGQWKERILGNQVSNVVLYMPSVRTNQTRISTLQSRAGGDHLESMFKSIKTAEKIQRKSEVNAAVEDTVLKFTTFPKDALEDLVSSSGLVLEPSVKEFVGGFLDKGGPDIDIEEIIGGLLKAYNDAVRMYREKNVT